MSKYKKYIKFNIIGIVVISILTVSYHFFNKTNIVNKINITSNKTEIKPKNFDKTPENGFDDNGKCTVMGSPCMMDLVRIENERLENHLAYAESLVQEKNSSRSKALAYKQKIIEEKRRKEEFEANRNFEEEINEYTPLVNGHLYLSQSKEVSLRASGFKDYVDDFDLSAYEGYFLTLDNYATFQTAPKETYLKYMKKNKEKSFSSFSLPHIILGNEYEEKVFYNCRPIGDISFECSDYFLSFIEEKKHYLKIRVQNNITNTNQNIVINEDGGMIVYDKNKDKHGEKRIKRNLGLGVDNIY